MRRRPRAEDWVLALWVAVAAPVLVRLEPGAGLFDGGRPMDGVLGIGALAGAALCLATGSADAPRQQGIGLSAAIGPFVGGLMLVAFSTIAALSLSEAAGIGAVIAIAALAVGVRLRWHVLPGPVRRALITPYILVTGGLFWSLIDAVTAGGDVTSAVRQAAVRDVGSALPVIGFLLAFSAVYYAMLIYAPRQVAEREGGVVTWVVRYGLFLASVALGAGWLSVLGG